MSAALLTKSTGTMTSTQFAGLFNRSLSDGAVYGVEITLNNGSISVGSGLLVMGGMVVAVVAETLTPSSGSELVCSINTTTGTAELITRAATALVQEDLYNGGDEYEIQLATYTVSGSSAGSVTKTVKTASAMSEIYVQQAQPSNPQNGALWFW